MDQSLYDEIFGQPDDAYTTTGATIRPGDSYDVMLAADAHGAPERRALIDDVDEYPQEAILLDPAKADVHRARVLIIDPNEDPEDHKTQWETVDIPKGQKIRFAEPLASDEERSGNRKWLVGAAAAGLVVTVAGIIVVKKVRKRRQGN